MFSKRLKEPSSWAGIATMLAAVGVISHSQAFAVGEVLRVVTENWPAIATLFAGAAAVALPERGGEPKGGDQKGGFSA